MRTWYHAFTGMIRYKFMVVMSFRSGVLRTVAFITSVCVALIVVVLTWQFLYTMLPDARSVITLGYPTVVAALVVLYVIVRTGRALEAMRTRESALAASEEKYARVYKRSPVPYLNIDREGNIMMVNLAAMRLLGLSAKRLLHKPLAEFLLPADDVAETMLATKLANRQSISDLEMQVKNADGGRHWVLLSVFDFDDLGERLVSMVDITRQKEVEEAKTEFVTLASHQLRTPIASIRWNVELLQGTHIEPSDEQQTYYQKVNRNIERVVSLVGDFLNVSKLELGTFATVPQPIVLDDFLHEVAAEFEEVTTTRNLQIDRVYTEQLGTARLDPRLMHIVVHNLLSNAVKYSDDGGVVTVTATRDNDSLEIIVADSGIGIPRTDIPELFTKFYRASNTRGARVEGTGLGLYLVKKSVAMMDGVVDVESHEGQGTTFTVDIPLQHD